MARYLQLVVSDVAVNNNNRRVGDYEYIKDYNVVNADGTLDQTFNGYVVQLVQKRSSANVKDGTTLNTTDEFLRYTNGRAKYMSYAYIEKFPVINGRAQSGDRFKSGGVARMNGRKQGIVTNPDPGDEPYDTSGIIDQIGTNLLFSAERDGLLKRFTWTSDKKRPASGLYETPVIHWPTIFEYGSDAANIPIHTLRATWDYAPNNQTVLSNYFVDNAPHSSPGDGPVPAERDAFCKGFSLEARYPGYVFHGVRKLPNGNWIANFCTKALCVGILLALGATYVLGTRGGRKYKQRKQTMRLRI